MASKCPGNFLGEAGRNPSKNGWICNFGTETKEEHSLCDGRLDTVFRQSHKSTQKYNLSDLFELFL